MELTETGFPKNFKNAKILAAYLYRKNAENEYVSLHRNTEPGTGRLHNQMWELKNNGIVTIEYFYLPDTLEYSNEPLFKVKLTPQYVEQLTNKRLLRISILVSILSLLIAVLAWIFPIK